MPNFANYKLGKLPPRIDPRTLRMASYVDPAKLPPIPSAQNWGSRVPVWPMMQNDRIGNCAVVGPAHGIQAWTANAQLQMFTPTDRQVIDAYSAISGYDPISGRDDQGCVMLDVMGYWKKVGIAGHKIGAFVSVEPTSRFQVQAGIHLFGGLHLGLALPSSAQRQRTWTAPQWWQRFDWRFGKGSWGGHAVYAHRYDAQYVYCVTWGGVQPMTWNFFFSYVEEAWATVSTDWINQATGKAPTGFNLKALLEDLEDVSPARVQ